MAIGLILSTIYVSLDPPPKRGLSYIEYWILGMLFPAGVAKSETILITFYMYKRKNTKVLSEKKRLEKIRKIDFFVGLFLFIYFMIFVASFCLCVDQKQM